jgi:hypothetical protein
MPSSMLKNHIATMNISIKHNILFYIIISQDCCQHISSHQNYLQMEVIGNERIHKFVQILVF